MPAYLAYYEKHILRLHCGALLRGPDDIMVISAGKALIRSNNKKALSSVVSRTLRALVKIIISRFRRNIQYLGKPVLYHMEIRLRIL